MNLDDVIDLATAADELGLAASTLRHQAQAGRLDAKVVGKTWITTREEVERYRRENLGQVGRPGPSSAHVVRQGPSGTARVTKGPGGTARTV